MFNSFFKQIKLLILLKLMLLLFRKRVLALGFGCERTCRFIVELKFFLVLLDLILATSIQPKFFMFP